MIATTNGVEHMFPAGLSSLVRTASDSDRVLIGLAVVRPASRPLIYNVHL